MNALFDELTTDLARFVKHLPNSDGKRLDRLTLILKGQLLIEEQVRRYVAERVPNPKPLRNLNAAQILSVAESLDDKRSWIWKAVAALNSLRNSVAHALEPETLQKKERHFREVSLKHLKPKDDPDEWSLETIIFGLHVRLGIMSRARRGLSSLAIKPAPKAVTPPSLRF